MENNVIYLDPKCTCNGRQTVLSIRIELKECGYVFLFQCLACGAKIPVLFSLDGFIELSKNLKLDTPVDSEEINDSPQILLLKNFQKN